MKKYDAIIQARLGSTRFKGKVLEILCGKPMLYHVIKRVEQCNRINRIIVATTTLSSDDPIVEFCKENGVLFFRGSENDVLDRFYNCSKHYKIENIVRVTADDPLKDPDVISNAIQIFETENYDYVTNTIEPTYPEGVDIEVFSFSSLKKVYKNAIKASEREHVTPFYYNNPKIFRIFNFKSTIDLSNIRLTVDSVEDFELIRRIYNHFYYKNGNNFKSSDVYDFLHHNTELLSINKGHKRNEGYINSISND